jgi:hypothetical protein
MNPFLTISPIPSHIIPHLEQRFKVKYVGIEPPGAHTFASLDKWDKNLRHNMSTFMSNYFDIWIPFHNIMFIF